MAISVSTNGGGSLRYPPIGSGGANFKTALAGREGFWLGFWFRTPTTFNASGGNSTILGGNADATTDGALAGLSGLVIAQRGPSASDPKKLNTTATGTNTGINRMWLSGGTSTAIWAGMTALDNPGVYFMAIGVRNVGAPGANDFRVFRAVIPRNGNAAAAQVEIGTPESTWLTLAVPFLNQIFVGSQGTASAATYTSAGTAVEHVGVIEGAFPFAGGLPDTALLAELASGAKTYSHASVLNGGSITSWRPLRSITDTLGVGSSSSDAIALTMRGTVVTDGETLAPGAWNPAGITINEKPDGHVFEAVLGPAAVRFTGTKQAGQTLEYRLLRQNGVVQIDWTGVGLSYPTGTTWLLGTTAPMRTDGLDYRLEVRDAAVITNVVSAANLFGVGSVIVGPHDQSTNTIMAENGKPSVPGALVSVAANNCRVAYASNRSGVPAPTYQVARLNDPANYGSGYMAMADQIGRDLGANHAPIMFVDVAVAGETVNEWIDDELVDTSADPARWRLWSGYMAFMAANCDYRATAFLKNNAVSGSTSYITTLAGLYDAMWVNNVSQNQVWLVGPWRNVSISPAGTVSLRDQIRALDTGSSRYKVLAHLPDICMDADGSNHQAAGQFGATTDLAGNPTSFFNGAVAHAAGNIRAGLKFGRGVVERLLPLLGLPVTVSAFGPAVLSAAFTDTGKTAIDVTFDRDIETPSGATTNLPQFWVTTDNWATQAQIPGAIISARKVRLTKPSGNWIGASVRFDYCRDTPWQPTAPVPSIAGGEVNILSSIDQLIYDTSGFEGGRGIVAQPILGNGIAVTDASSVAVAPAVVPVRAGSAAAAFAAPVQAAPAAVSLRVGTAVAGFTPAAPLPPTIMDVSLPPPRLLDGWGRRIKRLFGGSY